MSDPRDHRGYFPMIVAAILPLPILPVVALALRPTGRDDWSGILYSPGIVAFPFVAAKILPPSATFWAAGLFWYLAAAAILFATIGRRNRVGRTFFITFLVFAIALGLVWLSLRGWDPD